MIADLLIPLVVFLLWWASGLAALVHQVRSGKVPADRDTLILLGSLAALIGPLAWWAGKE